MTALLEIRNASKVFGERKYINRSPGLRALAPFNLTIETEPPSITAIVGESGSGKTTLARLLLGISAPSSGEILYRGTSLQRLSREQRLQFLLDIEVIFQDPHEVFNPFYK